MTEINRTKIRFRNQFVLFGFKTISFSSLVRFFNNFFDFIGK